MAESAILPVVKKLGFLLVDEANYLLQVKPEAESLHKELDLMTAFLKDADAIQHKSDRAKVWVRQLRELAFEQSEAEELAKLLMKEEPLGRIGVVSITGMGGLGKTTLAKKIYNRDDVKKHFNCQAFVRISKELIRTRDILYDIITHMLEKEVDLLQHDEDQ